MVIKNPKAEIQRWIIPRNIKNVNWNPNIYREKHVNSILYSSDTKLIKVNAIPLSAGTTVLFVALIVYFM